MTKVANLVARFESKVGEEGECGSSIVTAASRSTRRDSKTATTTTAAGGYYTNKSWRGAAAAATTTSSVSTTKNREQELLSTLPIFTIEEGSVSDSSTGSTAAHPHGVDEEAEEVVVLVGVEIDNQKKDLAVDCTEASTDESASGDDDASDDNDRENDVDDELEKKRLQYSFFSEFDDGQTLLARSRRPKPIQTSGSSLKDRMKAFES